MTLRERAIRWMLKAIDIDSDLLASTWNSVDYSHNNFPSLSREGYEHVATVYRCVNLVAKTSAGVMLGVFEETEDGEEIIKGHPLKQLFRRPNSLQSRAAYVKYWCMCMLLGGKAYQWANVLDSGDIAEMWVLPPADVDVQLGSTFGTIHSFTWNYQGRNIPLNPDHVLYSWFPNPRDFMMPMSPLQAAAQEVDLSNQGQRWNLSLLANYAKPPFVVTLDKDAEMTLKDSHVKDIKEALRSEYSGASNAGRAPVQKIPGLQLVPYGWSPQDMDWLQGLEAQDVRIANVYDVPPEFIGKAATYENRKEAVRALYDQAILPLMELLGDELTNWPIMGLPEEQWIGIQKDSIKALQEEQTEVAKRVGSLVDRGIITRNEARVDLNREPVDDPVADELTVAKEVVMLGETGLGIGTEGEI